MYADIGPSPGEGLRCEAMQLCFQDDKVEYAEVKSPNHEPPRTALISPSLLPGIHVTIY